MNHRFVPGTENDKGVLFGVAIVRVQGPDEYVHAFPEYVTEKEIVAMQSLPVNTVDSEIVSESSSSGRVPLVPITSVPQPLRPQSLTTVGSISGSLGGPSGTSPRATGPLGIGMGMGIGMGPVSFAMGGALAPQNVLLGSVRTSVSVPSTVVPQQVMPSLQQPAVPVVIPAALRETIKKVAQFCATNGASTISMLKKKEGAVNVMPFLFEGQVGFEEFLSTLKGILGMASTNGPTSSGSGSGSGAVPPPPVPPPIRPNSSS